MEIIPGTDGLLHISEIAEHRVREVKDELKEGDQVLVKVLGIEGNRIKLSRKAILKEQRAKLAAANGGGAPADSAALPAPAPAGQSEETVTFEGGGNFEENEGEPNFNREESNRETVSASGAPPDRPDRPDRGGDRPRGGRPHGRGGRGGPRRGPGGGRGRDRGPRRD